MNAEEGRRQGWRIGVRRMPPEGEGVQRRMEDKILEGFLKQQELEGMALAAASDILELQACGPRPIQDYVATFHCKGAVKVGDRVDVADRFVVAIHFPDDYQRTADPTVVLQLLFPWNMFHPNVFFPMICAGHLTPGTGLCDLLYQCYHVLTGRKISPGDPLNTEAAAWARSHPDFFPTDTRPLKRRLRAAPERTKEETPL